MPRKYTPRVCERCGKEFLAVPSEVRRGFARFCSRSCRSHGSMPMEERFWTYVQKSENGCWIWSGTRTKFGHGMFSVDGKQVYTHRLSWEMHNGPIPDGLHVLHRCDVPSCVRPDHLFLGTQADNIRDMVEKGRHWTPLTEEDVCSIRQHLANGMKQRDIAKIFAVDQKSIWNIAHGKTWAHHN